MVSLVCWVYLKPEYSYLIIIGKSRISNYFKPNYKLNYYEIMNTMLLIKFSINSRKLLGRPQDVTPDMCCAGAGSNPNHWQILFNIVVSWSVSVLLTGHLPMEVGFIRIQDSHRYKYLTVLSLLLEKLLISLSIQWKTNFKL